ncbi:hypothetical protein BJY21_002513 [Kineosphaera limosa]|uniref:Uncharacterized protein n=1 Tax=Kineosphaera limosa NBRC 100340 TaxID=1184609 RepID=K6X9J2_9MICO|nr:hypothetical protein [Kineosphaera limosa]NYE01329.1 hypothetical protein [Kineosphaera limosa]GAB95499.1 hypothetical protein KILIM_021_00390 [Kineosphaera limosa NBRC 100340]
MSADRHTLHDLVDELPDEQVALVIADVRRRLVTPAASDRWPPEFFGVIQNDDLPEDLAQDPDQHLAAYGFGRDSR